MKVRGKAGGSAGSRWARIAPLLVGIALLLWLPAGPAGAQERPAPPEGAVYTWQDGDRTRKVWLQEDLTVTSNSPDLAPADVIAETGGGPIVSITNGGPGGAESDSQPVFRSESGSLMTLPGGILLAFRPDWDRDRINTLFTELGIDRRQVSPLAALPNGFVVQTEPGFPSLELANALAGRTGVALSSPNWWFEVETK